MNSWSKINLQDANSPIMENLIMFHDHAMMIITMINFMIIYILLTLFINKFNNKFIMQNQMIEIIWTTLPMIILIFLAIPSLKILYLTDEIMNPLMTIKTIGHQWYWSYEYSDFKNIEFNSFMLNSNYSSLSPKLNNLFRLLDVDNRLIIPFNNQLRILTTSIDVIHAWTIPNLGIKMDSIPGRINQTSLTINRPGIMFGQCSEICGMNHSFMPIVIESTSKSNFINWLKSNSLNN